MHCNLKVARRRALVLGFYCEAYNAAFKLNTSATSAEPQCTGTSNFSAIGQYAVSYNDLKMGNFGAVRHLEVQGKRTTVHPPTEFQQIPTLCGWGCLNDTLVLRGEWEGVSRLGIWEIRVLVSKSTAVKHKSLPTYVGQPYWQLNTLQNLSATNKHTVNY